MGNKKSKTQDFIEAKGDRNVASDQITHSTIITGDIKKSIVNIYNALPLWVKAVILSTSVIVLLTFSLVINLNCRNNQCWSAPQIQLNENQFRLLEPSELGITALALGDDAVLWMGTQSETGYALYQIDTKQKDTAIGRHVVDENNQITGLTIDGKGNVWMLITDTGVQVYDPKAGRQDLLLNKENTKGWLAKSNIYAIATRQIGNGTIEVWLGREGVHTLQYSGDNPQTISINLIPWEEDKVYQVTKNLKEIRSLIFDEENEVLFAANRKPPQISSYSFRTKNPSILDIKTDNIWSMSKSLQGTLWVGSDTSLFQVNIGNQIGLNSFEINNRAFTVAMDDKRSWLWLGDRCAEGSTTCKPLGVYQNQVSYLKDGLQRKEVRGIIVDQNDNVWIGTEKGLFFFPVLE